MLINPKKIVWAAVLLVIVFSVAYLAKRYSPNYNDAKLYETRELYSKLPIAPGFTERGSSFQSKAELALVSKYFDSKASYDEVKAFYQSHLSESGWTLTEERPMRDWWRDFGGRRLEFRKGDYFLVIEYAGEKASDQWDYAIDLIWKNPQYY